MFKTIHHYFRGRWEHYYLRSHWHLVLDLSMSLVVIILTIAVVGLYFYRPSLPNFDKILPDSIVDLNNPPLELSYSIVNPSVKITEGTELKIVFKNNGQADVNNFSLNFLNKDANFSINRLEIIKSDLDFNLNGRELKSAQIKVGEGGEVLLKVYFNQKSSVRNIDWQAQGQYIYSGKLFRTMSDLPSLVVIAELKVQELAYYTSPQGDQLGIGPLPPIVGIPTSYWIFWEAESASDFKNLVFSARLPKGVELGSGRSLLAGEFSYSTSSRQAIWKIAELKGNSSSYRLGFEVQLTPSLEQLGNILPLLTNSRYYGVDALSGKEIKGSFTGITTNLEDDHFNSGEGKVVN